MFDYFDAFGKLGFLLRCLEIGEKFHISAKVLAHANDFIKDSVLLVLNHPTEVNKSPNAEALVFTPPAFQELVTIWPNKGNSPSRCWRPKRWFFAVLENHPLLSFLVVRCPKCKRL